MKRVKIIENKISIQKSKAEVWDVLYAGFGDINNFNPMLVGSRLLEGDTVQSGSERQCDLAAGISVKEKLTLLRENEAFKVTVIDGPPSMMSLEVNMEVSAEGDNTTLVTAFLTSDAAEEGMTVKEEMAADVGEEMSKVFQMILIGLKYHLETGGLVSMQGFEAIQMQYDSQGKSDSSELAVA